MTSSREALKARRAELVKRMQAIEADLQRGLDPDAEEQAVQLENMEVLQEIHRLAEKELAEIDEQLSEIRDR